MMPIGRSEETPAQRVIPRALWIASQRDDAAFVILARSRQETARCAFMPLLSEWSLVCWPYGSSWCNSWREKEAEVVDRGPGAPAGRLVTAGIASRIIPLRAITGVNACGRGNRQQFQYHLSQDPPSRRVRGAPPPPTPSTPSLSNWRRNVSAAQLPRPHGSSMSARDSRDSDWELRAPFVKNGTGQGLLVVIGYM